MNRVIINAPFGNYLTLRGATSILGTFTLNYRGGFWWRLWRCLLTLRYYPGIKAWKNKLGLPNPGIRWLEERWVRGKIELGNKIISVSARKTENWIEIINRANAMKPLGIELNVSCPNTDDIDDSDYERVFRFAAMIDAIVKLPPVRYYDLLSLALSQGISRFNCCNTYPTGNGGLSGKPLKLLSLECVEEVKRHKAKMIIGTGGITDYRDVGDYILAGATHIGLASIFLNPFNWGNVRPIINSFEDIYAHA